MDVDGVRTPRRWLPDLVWAAGTLAYVTAVASRSSVGVAGVVATDRYQVSAADLSTLMVVQFAIYAAAQIPVGVALDRFGSRKVLTTGMAVIALGQVAMALAPTFPLAVFARLLVGIGDAATWISVVRLVAAWFPNHRVALFTQISAAIGQTGQIVSAVPVLGLLTTRGWTAAFGALGISSLIIGIVIALLVRDYPADRQDLTANLASRPPLKVALHGVVTTPGAWLGFFTHWSTLFTANTFVMLWGLPFLTQGHGMPSAAVGAFLTVCSFVSVGLGPLVGWVTGRFPHRRAHLSLAFISFIILGWVVFLIPDDPASTWRLALLAAAIGLGGPACAVGFDLARTAVPFYSIGSASGFVNVGGYTACLLGVWLVGLVLDWRTDAAVRSLDDYRMAFAALGLVMAIGLTGFFVSWWRTNLRAKAGT